MPFERSTAILMTRVDNNLSHFFTCSTQVQEIQIYLRRKKCEIKAFSTNKSFTSISLLYKEGQVEFKGRNVCKVNILSLDFELSFLHFHSYPFGHSQVFTENNHLNFMCQLSLIIVILHHRIQSKEFTNNQTLELSFSLETTWWIGDAKHYRVTNQTVENVTLIVSSKRYVYIQCT